MSSWLTVPQALVLIDKEPGDVGVPAFSGALNGAREWVETKRSDLFITDEDDERVFQPGAGVLLGTAMLANRFYERRSSPLGVASFSEFSTGTILRWDPDMAKLLGIGTEGAFVFGAAGYVPAEIVEESA